MRLLAALLLLGCSEDPAGIRGVAADVTRTLPTLEEEVTVLRAEHSIAHIYAKSMLDLHRAQGFITAQDRYVQIELTRRFGAGTLSEVLGDLGVEIDAAARGRGFAKVQDQIWNGTDEAARGRFEAYAEGVNAYVEVVKRGQLPVPEEIEIAAGLVEADRATDVMQPMTGKDVAAVAAVLVSRLGFEGSDVSRAAVAQELADLPEDPLKQILIDQIFYDVSPVHTIAQARPGERGSALTPELTSAAQPLRAEPTMLNRLAAQNERFSTLVGHARPGEAFGSNAWAISSKGTGDRGAILANDGHLPLTVPSLFYQQCLDVEYFGDEAYRVCGLFFPGVPFVAVGTNGHVAWGQTYLDGDVVDYYREEIELGADGLPARSLFMGEWMPLVRVDERYATPSGEEVIPRWETFDGRFLADVEGDVTSAPGPSDFFALGRWISPRDVDGDGVIEAVSFDWTAFDIGQTLSAVDGFARAESVEAFKDETRKLVAYAQNLVVADKHGDIMYSAYHALPCRDFERAGNRFATGANPQELLDGTLHGGFEIRVDDQGRVIEEDCVVPFDVGPRVESPNAGFVVTANHDPLGYGFDGSLADDPAYIGGPWSLGYRAHTIEEALARIVAEGSATLESSASLQADHRSVLGLRYGPDLVTALRDAGGFDDTADRIDAWIARGALAKSGVETFYAAPTPDDRTDAVATMIFNQWLRIFIDETFDEPMADRALSQSRTRRTFRQLDRMMSTPDALLFDRVATASVTEQRDAVMVLAMERALERLASADGFGTDDRGQWLWGLKHQVRFVPLVEEVGADNPLVGLIAFKFGLTTENLPLAENLPAGDPRAAVVDFPRDGDWFGVDAANPGFSGRFSYRHGPVMRMVIHLDGDRVEGQNILPGGQSGLLGDPHFGDQAAQWLGNQTVPLRFFPEEAVEGVVTAETFSPPP